MTDNILLS